MEIYIVRHGETMWNKVKRFQGSADIELSDAGRDLARKSGMNLRDIPLDRVFSSPLCRARETAELFCGGRDIRIEVDERLRELNFGHCEGQLYEDLVNNDSLTFKYFFSQPELYHPDDAGETIEDMMARARAFMQEVVEPLAASCHRIMIVAHGALNKGLMAYVNHREVKDLWAGGLQKNCGVIILSYADGNYTTIDENRIFYTA